MVSSLIVVDNVVCRRRLEFHAKSRFNNNKWTINIKIRRFGENSPSSRALGIIEMETAAVGCACWHQIFGRMNFEIPNVKKLSSFERETEHTHTHVYHCWWECMVRVRDLSICVVARDFEKCAKIGWNSKHVSLTVNSVFTAFDLCALPTNLTSTLDTYDALSYQGIKVW